MPTINKTADVPYTQQQMYELVDDIALYSEFVPWCVATEILYRDEDEVRAKLSFASGAIQKSFTTLNRLQPHKMVEIRLVKGPFRMLEGFWRFEELDDGGCRVMLDLEFEFSNRLLALMFGPVFSQVATTLVDSFVKRANEVLNHD